VQNRAIFNHDAARVHVACNFAGAPNLNALVGLEGANHLAANDNFAGFDFRGNPSVGADRESTVGNMNPSFENAVHGEIPLTGEFSFDTNAPTHGDWRARKIRRHRVIRMLL
jgi:hypothetical protein